MYHIKVTKEFGRGLYATNHINEGTLISKGELLELTREDTVKLYTTHLKNYTFKLTDTTDCLVLGDGELFNHSEIPNVGYKLVDFEGRKVMEFYTVRCIMPGDQLFIDYCADVPVNIQEYMR